jgi:hypothetical protein
VPQARGRDSSRSAAAHQTRGGPPRRQVSPSDSRLVSRCPAKHCGRVLPVQSRRNRSVPHVRQGFPDETKNHMVDGQESGHFTERETETVLSLVGRAIAAILRWMQYLESPAARAFYAKHRGRRRGGDAGGPASPPSKRPRTKRPDPKNPEP